MKLLYITNIPSLYRNKRFSLMQSIFPRYGIDFETLYMASREPNRSWIVPEDTFQYNYKIYGGIHFSVSNFYMHFNPGLLIRLLKNDYDIIVIGGLSTPTHWLATVLSLPVKVKIISIESNLTSVRRKTGLAYLFKRLLLKQASAYQITGLPQKGYIQYFFPEASSRNFVVLPNLIDETVYVEKVDIERRNRNELRDALGISSTTKALVLVGRLSEEKGIEGFLAAMRGFSGYHLFILGDGPLIKRINEQIEAYGLNVTLVGFVQEAELVKYYALADIFVLPSLRDASPLSPIEAIAAGLPILISSNIGNFQDVFRDNHGWSFQPDNIDSVRKAIAQALEVSFAKLEAMGENARICFREKFDSNSLINSYARQLRKLTQWEIRTEE